ncbi:MAG TPA: hypothetical protein VK789_17055 [Bryobacteraceae bacterium]|nr:hypothetical protein [Bryobacteraceae bacterium]
MILKVVMGVSLLFAAGVNAQQNAPPEKGQPFRLATGDFRWIPFTVRQTPAAVDCHFEVVDGNPTVHVELLPMSEFRLFDRGMKHDTLVVTPEGRSGEFRRIINVSGQYAVVVVNGKRSPPATVSLQVRTSVNPDATNIARTLPPSRRLTVILISFAFFFITVTWSARMLIRGMKAN